MNELSGKNCLKLFPNLYLVVETTDLTINQLSTYEELREQDWFLQGHSILATACSESINKIHELTERMMIHFL